MRTRNAALAAGLALVLLASPSLALAQGVAGTEAVVVDRSDFYEPLEGEADAVETLAETRALVQISDEMKYFTKYESHGNYDQGFSVGDGYNALGYYQFDRRYSLIPFMRYCLEHDADKYAMLADVVARASEVTDAAASMYDAEKGELTELGQLVQDAWHAAYAADPTEFSLLQDNYAYNNYYRLSESYLASRGIDMSGRPDCVKGLVWSMTNLFGSGGVRWFLDEAGLSNALSDRAFVNRLVDALVNNIDERYPSQPNYHAGWISRYERERADCLGMIGGAPSFTDVASGAWYEDTVLWAADRGLFNGQPDGTFQPERTITRAEMAAVLYNLAGSPDVSVGSLPSDCQAGAWYASAVCWALEVGAFNGNADGTFAPNAELTREQAAAVIMNMAGVRGQDTSARADLSRFPDAADVSPWFGDCMSWAVAEGVISGVGEQGGVRTLSPQEPCSRAVVAAIMMNWIDG